MLAVVLAGPRVVILMPIWLVGFACYRMHYGLKIRKFFGYCCVTISVLSYLAIRATNLDDVLFSYSAIFIGGEDKINTMLGFSKRFAPDYFISMLFLIMFYGLLMVREDFYRPFLKMRPIIKILSAYTFSLYLFHYPLLTLFSHVTDNTWVALFSCVCITVAIGYFTETRKKYLANLIECIFNVLSKRRVVSG